jgi:hypothetical protein
LIRWRQKAAVARICARLPLGDRLYRFGQRHFGELRAAPARRLAVQAEMLRWLHGAGLVVHDCNLLEVGTGHIPVLPIGFYLSGARGCTTVDLNRRLDWGLTRATLGWIAAHRDEVKLLYSPVVERVVLEERLATLVELRHHPARFLEHAAIRYLAPEDAARLPLPAASVDCHYSMTVLEHIAPAALRDILREARRVLKPQGVALHFIDPSDHFAHADRSISAINFLRYSEPQWQHLAGNEFAYCNRLRASDFVALGAELGFRELRRETTIDAGARQLIGRGFEVDPGFAHYSVDDLCTTSLRVMWQ